ncbi:MAG: hypothetical protein ACRCSV_04845, partial [Chlamydiales bacterium]
IFKNNNIDIDDWSNLQTELRKNDIESLVSQYYSEFLNEPNSPADPNKFPCDSFVRRAKIGMEWTFIDKENKKVPKRKLCKINKGSDCCIVCVSSYCKQYPELMLSNIFHLKKSGFNGYYLYFLGEYPNPSGEELQYVGVPYAFKIFALLEAKKLGFNKVLWLDASMQPLRNPEPLFDIIEKQGAFFTTATSLFPWWEDRDPQRKLLPQTRDRLFELTNIDAAYSKHYVPATIFGFNMDHPLTSVFIDKYYEIVRDGYGFISDAPEEYVYSCILSQDIFNDWQPTITLKLLSNKKERILTEIRKEKIQKPYLGFFKKIKKVTKHIYEEKELHEKSEKEGYFFYYRAH